MPKDSGPGSSKPKHNAKELGLVSAAAKAAAKKATKNLEKSREPKKKAAAKTARTKK